MRRFTDDQLEKEVLVLLRQHNGKQNAIGRWELVAKIYGPEACFPEDDNNFADRKIREAVASLRRQGVLICDMGDGKGRYLAQTLEEYQSFRQYYGSGAFEKLTTIREMDKAAESVWPNVLQPRLL
jgi:hypothetical protein